MVSDIRDFKNIGFGNAKYFSGPFGFAPIGPEALPRTI
jgi:hypothetical protein